MEDIERFIEGEREKKIAENIKKVVDLFKDEVQKEGGTIKYEARYGDTLPKFYISDGISGALKEKINAYVSQFYTG